QQMGAAGGGAHPVGALSVGDQAGPGGAFGGEAGAARAGASWVVGRGVAAPLLGARVRPPATRRGTFLRGSSVGVGVVGRPLGRLRVHSGGGSLLPPAAPIVSRRIARPGPTQLARWAAIVLSITRAATYYRRGHPVDGI